MRAAQVDVAPRGAFTEEQRRALKSAFRVIEDTFKGTVLLRGSLLERPISMATLPLSMELPFNAKPEAIIVLSATQVSDGTVISMPPIRWNWTPTADTSTAFITDIDIDDVGDFTLSILVLRAAVLA